VPPCFQIYYFKMASSSTEFRLGYWFVTMDNSKEESIILVIKKTEQEVTFRQCNFPLGDQEDNTGKDLYVSHSISKIPTPSLHFLRVAFALSPVAFNRCKTWGPRVFCCMTPGYLNDNADEELEASRLFRKKVVEGMTSKIPYKRLRRFTTSMSPTSFRRIFGFLKPKQHHHRISFGKWTYLPGMQETPTLSEYTFVGDAKKMEYDDAFDLVQANQLGQLKGSTAPIVLARGPTSLLSQRKNALKKSPEAIKSVITLTHKSPETIHRVHLDTKAIQLLEDSIGHFTSKAMRGRVISSRFIEAKREKDPEYVKDCKMVLAYSEEKMELSCSFNYLIRNTTGEI